MTMGLRRFRFLPLLAFMLGIVVVYFSVERLSIYIAIGYGIAFVASLIFGAFHLYSSVCRKGSWALSGLILVISFPVNIITIGAYFFRYFELVRNGEPYEPTRWEALYFSIVSWTTLGYGDLVPSESSRIFAAIIALFGYIFSGYLIAFTWRFLTELTDYFSHRD